MPGRHGETPGIRAHRLVLRAREGDELVAPQLPALAEEGHDPIGPAALHALVGLAEQRLVHRHAPAHHRIHVTAPSFRDIHVLAPDDPMRGKAAGTTVAFSPFAPGDRRRVAVGAVARP